MLQKIWVTDKVPTQFAKAVFIMIYKGKGSSNDPTKYRCIGLLNHTYKVLSQCMLARLTAEIDGFLTDSQAGFRSTRGCRDNIMILRTLTDDILEKGQGICATLIDYAYSSL